MITETVFENRFMHVAEFRRMNANITVEGRSAKIQGKSQLQGAQVKATDFACEINIRFSRRRYNSGY